MSEDLTGKRLGNYRIDGVLGKGGMSVMYRATDVRLGRKVALKVIAEHLTADPEFRERFVDEARNTSAIDHANIVPLYDFGEVDGLLYIAMRMVDGSDLAKLIAPGPLAPSRGVALLTQVGAALDMLHERGLVHLDVKPANVLVTTKESADEHIYLADFGLTRRGATGHRTRTGDFLGSPTYAAPEHLRGEPVDARTDQYSLACVLYACLTGRPPYRGQVPDVISGHLGGEIPKVTSVVELPEAIDGVLAKGMAKRSGDRYPNCRAMITAAKETFAGMAEPDRAPRTRRAGAGSAAVTPANEQTRPGVPAPVPASGPAGQNVPSGAQAAPVRPGMNQQGGGGEPMNAGGLAMNGGWPQGPYQGQPQQGQPQQGQPPQGQPPQGQPQQGQPQPGQQQPHPPQPPPQNQPPQQNPYGQGPGMGRPPQQQPYPPQQPGYPAPGQPYGQQPYPGQQPQQGFGAPYPGHTQDPVRLRAPMPAGSSAFGPESGKERGAKRWLWPVIIGAVVVIAAVVVIILLTRDSGSGSGSGGNGQVTVPTNGPTTTLGPPPTKLPGS